MWAIALNTFREAVRDRVLHGVLAFACAILLFTLALAELSLNQEERVVHDVGLASISLFSVAMAIFLGSSLLYKEIERKTLYVILPKPIRRHEFLLGKYVGIAITAFVFIAVMGAFQLWIAAVQAGADLALALLVLAAPVIAFGIFLWRARDRTSVVVPWAAIGLGACTAFAAAAGVKLGPFLAALLLTFGEVLVLAAIALFFSSFSTPFLTGVLTLGVWLVGRSAQEMATMRSTAIGPEIKAALRAVAEIAPNLSLFVPGRHALESYQGHGGPAWYVAKAMGYGVLYAAIVLVLAALVFRRRDFA